jgi:hypothetical protein
VNVPNAATILLATALIAWCSGAWAQPRASSSVAITPVYQFDGDLDSGGDAGYAGVFTSLGHNWVLSARATLGLGLSLDYEDWHFSDIAAFDGRQPWTDLYRAGISAPYSYTTDGGWRWTFSPTLEYAGEAGASASDALEYGALLSAARRLGPDLTLGVGVGVYERIEQTRAFPFLIVNWRITDRLRLTNPLPAGPSGPAGLELSYALGSGWEIGIAAAVRSFRFRLDEEGPIPNGVGENAYVPLVARIGRQFSDTLTLNLYAGAALAGNLRIEDPDGNRLYDEDRDPAALIGLSLVGRF